MEAERKVYGKQAFFVAEKMYNHNNNYYYECKIGLRKRKKIIIIQMWLSFQYCSHLKI